ncbi:hypothetical protein P4H27_10015 [Paenibacillus taichungensis]|uniref:phage tail assembly chaperone n=1 Tax=Paenibacillus taichungensis TaxID=484184 RepID=UPI002DB5EA53|nr:hypothetical protein [Paenibacillus taichungensis]MEC0107271.1 hypothetical protein [Paenibacillus taichungensis]MEC0194797.1 hypothetical protein [Paenibacillus taichungensis]
MSTETTKKLSLTDLIGKKVEKEAEKNRTSTVYVAGLGGEIEVSNPGERVVYGIMDMDSTTSENAMYANAKLVYQSVKLFQEKELQDHYEVVDPIDIVFRLLKPVEIKLVAEEIMQLAGFSDPEAMRQALKN